MMDMICDCGNSAPQRRGIAEPICDRCAFLDGLPNNRAFCAFDLIGHFREHGPQTTREIAEHFYAGKINSAYIMLRRLAKKGRLKQRRAKMDVAMTGGLDGRAALFELDGGSFGDNFKKPWISLAIGSGNHQIQRQPGR